MGRWSTGRYRSQRDGKVYAYKSSWEAIYMDKIDSCSFIKNWSYEPFYVMYLDGSKVKKYHPDFIVETIDGRKIIVEIKPERLRENVTNTKKRQAILQKCSEESWEYHEWSPGEDIIPTHCTVTKT